MLEVTQRQTAAFLKSKIIEILKLYDVSLDQVFAVTVDNGANMCAAVKELTVELERAMLAEIMFEQDDDEEQDNAQRRLSAGLLDEFGNQINLIRCSVHTLQLAILDVVNKSHESVKAVTEIAKRCKNVKYKPNFKDSKATYPPVWNQTRWCGIYSMMENFVSQESFYKQLAEEYPELGKLYHTNFW